MNGRRERILVVDDNAQNRLLARAHLETAGYEVVLADGGVAAIETFERDGADLVLLDVMMPDVDGFEACRRLRELSSGRSTPIVFLTALTETDAHEKALASGGDDFLSKPIRKTELLIRVRSLLRIGRLNHELRARTEELERVQKLTEELTALVVHDLKTPLAAIVGNVDYIATDDTVPTYAREAAGDAKHAAKAMNRMVMNLLDIARSEDGKLTLASGRVDLVAIAREVGQLVMPVLTARKQELVIDVDVAVTDAALSADGDLLRRMLENLVDNASKYSRSGTSIGLSARRSDGRVEIAVEDEGPGIGAEHKARVFDKYYRVSGSPEGRSSRGLGLAFCRIAAEAHGGSIRVEDKPTGRGSRFVITLPA